MILRGYKVTNYNKRSAISFGSSVVDYSQRRSAYPSYGCGPLTVFTTLAEAVRFQSQVTGRIFTCFYIKSDRGEVWNTNYSMSLEELLVRNSDCLTPGTVCLADEVILGQEVLL